MSKKIWGRDPDLERRQREHLERVFGRTSFRGTAARRCLHDSCSQCVGTGIKADGTPCVHMISCSCPRCTPYSLSCSAQVRACL